MRVINYFDSDKQSHWLSEIKRGDWGAAGFLHELLSKKTFFDITGKNSISPISFFSSSFNELKYFY